MGVLHESRLDNTVDAGAIGIGERIDVRTRMGGHVATGEVIASNPFGLVLKEGGFYGRDMYLFAPIEEEPPIVVLNSLHDSPDDRVAAKTAEMGLSHTVYEADKMYGDTKKDDTEKSDDSKSDDDSMDDEDPDNDVEPNDDGKKALASPGSSIDVDKLPEDIKKSIISTTQMDGDQLNSVLSEIGDATVKAMKRVNVRDTEIYGSVAKVQNAVHRILTGKPPAPHAPPKKAKKK